MKLIIISGPPAVGKMTVGQELEKLTELKLFHNHMTLDLVENFFDSGSPEAKKLVTVIRKEIFKAAATSNLKGLIFTFAWVFDRPYNQTFITDVKQIFEEQGAPAYHVELEARFEERIKRNTTPNRLKYKPTKRDIAVSEMTLRETTKKYRLNSDEGEIDTKNYIRINNTDILPEGVAKQIRDHFQL